MGGYDLGHPGIVVGGQEHQAVTIEAEIGRCSAPDADIGVTRQLGEQGIGQIRVVERAVGGTGRGRRPSGGTGREADWGDHAARAVRT